MTMMETFEQYLKEKVNEGMPSLTKEAMSYSLMNGGKRVRPQILFSILKDYGLDPQYGFPCGCAIEMIHTYSLIHDDLPCMDDDDLRRGKPSCHKAYNEAVAVLAGDALLTKAFQVALETACSDAQKIEVIQRLSQDAGIEGMILGQDLDMKFENSCSRTFEDLINVEVYKTAKLLTLPMVCAAILSNHKEDLPIWEEIGTKLGIQFQVQDDILDVTSTSEVLGKSTSDLQNNKLTAISLLGLDPAKDFVLKLDQEIEALLNKIHSPCENFKELKSYLINRTY